MSDKLKSLLQDFILMMDEATLNYDFDSLSEEEAKIEVEIEAAAEVPAEEPKKDEAMAKVEQAMGDLEKKVEELTAKVKAMEEKAEEVKEAVKMSAVVLESLAKEPSDKAITAPNQFAKQLKTEKNERFNNLQKAFSTLKK